MLVTRLQQTMKDKKDMQFAIIKDSQPGAWAIYAPLCYGIVITTGLILKMQAVCGCVIWLMHQSRAQPEGADNFVSELWRGMPHGNEDCESFGGLLAHIAFAFVIHHELAHAGLGHDAIDGEAKEIRSAPAYKADQTKVQVIHESSIAAKATHPPIPARVMAILVAGSRLYERQNDHQFEGLSNVLLFVAGLLGLSITVNEKYRTLDDLLDGLRINDVVNRLEEIGTHFGTLAKMRSDLNSRLRLRRRFPDYLCWAWFEDMKLVDGTDHIYGKSVMQPK
jgi:hypothetical protein